MADINFYPTAIQNQYDNDPRLALAKALMAQSTGNQPVRTPVQGWSNVLQGILGKYQQDKLQQQYGQRATEYRGHQAELAKALMGDQADPQTQTIMQSMQGNPDTADSALPFAMNIFTARNAAKLKEQERKDARTDQRRTVDTGAEIITYDGNGQELSRQPKAVAPGTQAQIDAAKSVAAESHRHNVEMEGIDRDKAKQAENGRTTDTQRQSAFLISRLEKAKSDIAAATQGAPGAKLPSAGATFMGMFGDTARNFTNSPNRQRVEAAQDDALDAALTLATGAAYNKEQLQGLRRSYFPQLGDDPATVKDKQSRFDTLIQSAYARAGNAPVNTPNGLGVNLQPGMPTGHVDPNDPLGLRR